MSDRCEFEKVLMIPDDMYGDMSHYVYAFTLLMDCMKRTNEQHGRDCEFFRLTFRPGVFGEKPHGCLAFELRWGIRDECKGDSDNTREV